MGNGKRRGGEGKRLRGKEGGREGGKKEGKKEGREGRTEGWLPERLCYTLPRPPKVVADPAAHR
jgi:hypothetical protein